MLKTVRIVNLGIDPHPIFRSDEHNIVTGNQIPALQMISLFLDNHVQHVVQDSNLSPVTELELSSMVSKSPDLFFKFPLSSIFAKSAPTTETEAALSKVSFKLSNISERAAVQEEIVQLMESSRASKTLIGDVRMVSDELITNSVYNAPHREKGTVSRDANRAEDRVQIDPEKKPHFFAASDEERLVVGCTDQYGSLNVKKFFERIRTCYVSNPGNVVNFGAGGAGIGAFMMLESCASFYIAVDEGQSTTVVCVFPLKLSGKQRLELPKNLHIVQREQGLQQDQGPNV